MGKPIKLTDEAITQTCRAIETGASMRQAAEFAGIGYSTLRERIGKDPMVKAKILEAQAKFTVVSVAVIQKAAQKGNWSASAFLLDRQERVDKPEPPGINLAAAKQTIATLREIGRLTDEHHALEVSFLALAEAVDRNGENASLWRQYLLAEANLRGAQTSGEDDKIGQLLRRLQTPLGDEEDTGAEVVRPARRKNRPRAASAPDAVAKAGSGRRPRAAAKRKPGVSRSRVHGAKTVGKDDAAAGGGVPPRAPMAPRSKNRVHRTDGTGRQEKAD